jgi:hypothetical protein
MTAIEDFAKTLKGVAAVQRRPQPKLTNAEIAAITDAAKPFFEAYEAMIAELRESVPQAGPAWYGYGNDGSEYTGDQKQEVLHQWMRDNEVPDEKSLLRATLGERGEGPRARGPITFYTFPSPTGIIALWVARSDNLPLLQGMVSAIVSNGDEDEEE